MPRFKFARPLSLVFVAALVFAPGEHWLGSAQTTQKDSANIVARMLAPTLDQGLAGEGRFGGVDLSSQEKAKRGIRVWAGALLFAAFCVAAASRRLLLLSGAMSRAERVAHSRIRRRGPPLLQPA